MLQRIMVPLDGSELAEKALPYAEALATKFAGELLLVMVIQTVVVPAVASHYGEGILIDYPPRERVRQDAHDYLAAVQQRLEAQQLPVRSIILENESVADALIETAGRENVDVIVKTTHGRSGLSRWVFGNVATKVLQGAACPVFLVRVSDGGSGAS
ncbi:MAG: universal stress protein [Anaerolineales bacterium]|nr:universal stress protein [Anaerolineales bacterium]